VLSASSSLLSLQAHGEVLPTRRPSGHRKLQTPSAIPSVPRGDGIGSRSDAPSLVPTSATSMLPSVVPTIASPRPTFSRGVCNVCGEGRVVTNPDGKVNDTTTNTTYLCALLEQRGNGGFIAKPEDCSLVQSLADEPCQCGVPPSPSASPIQSSSPSRVAPNSTSSTIASRQPCSRLSLITITILFSSWVSSLA
jgi:hypothetical protein